MSDRNHHRGHLMYFDLASDAWKYADDDTLVRGQERPCGHCEESTTPKGHDPCISDLPGVMNACCGHGRPQEAYVQFSNWKCIRGQHALDIANEMKRRCQA